MRTTKSLYTAAALAALMTSSPSFATDYSSGNYWLPICQSANASHDMQCLSYVRGVWDGITLLEALASTAPYFCVPKSVTVGQAKDVFVKYLKDNPKNRHLSGDVLIMTSLIQAYPCKKGSSN